ncbi:MAG: flavodoxin family protein [Candidatus Hadarchaeia archaeon]
MRALIICKSCHHYNTLKIAKAIGEVLDADIRPPNECEPSFVKDYDLMGFGSGIYWGKYHEDIFSFVEKLSETYRKYAFIFSTSGLGKIPILNDYGRRIREKLEEKGFHILGEFSCRGHDTFSVLKLVGGIYKGRPNRENIFSAKEFAENIREKIED